MAAKRESAQVELLDIFKRFSLHWCELERLRQAVEAVRELWKDAEITESLDPDDPTFKAVRK